MAVNMPAPNAPAQIGQLPGKANEYKEMTSGVAEASAAEVKTVAAESARTAAMKARKRTKTGCLSMLFRVFTRMVCR